jgi:hypothetical protein
MSTGNSNLILSYQLYFPLAIMAREAEFVLPCPHCHSNLQLRSLGDVPSTKALECPKCSGVFTLSGCGNCKAIFGLTPSMRNALSRTRSTICPACKVELICFLWPSSYSRIFELDGKGGYELVLPRTSKKQRFEFSEGTALVFSCFNCEVELHKLGILHEPIYCGQCGACNYLIACSHCGQLFSVSCETKDALSTVINCPHCEVYLTWPTTYMELSGTHTRSLREWSDDAREGEYIRRSNDVLPDPEKQRLAVYHATTGARISGAEYHFEQLKKIELRTLRLLSDDGGASNAPHKEEAKFSQETLLDVYAFGFVNSLRSSLDIVAQELALLFSLTLPENEIDFRIIKLRGKLPAVIEDQILAFQKSDDYLYLNRLRNAVQHKRIWLERTKAIFNAHPVTGGEEPVDTKILLPDNPNALPGTQTYLQNKELLITFIGLLTETKDFLFNIYGIAAQTR